MQKRICLLFIILAQCVLAGCGGGGGSTGGAVGAVGAAASSAGRGAVQVAIAWPASRAAGLAFNSVNVTLTANGQKVAEQLVSHPAGVTTTNATLTNVPPGALTLTLHAFASSDGSGQAIASGSRAITVTAGQTAQAGLSRAAPVADVKIMPPASPIIVGGTGDLTASALDADGNVVLASDAEWQWSSSNTNVATIVGNGDSATVTGYAEGEAIITVQKAGENIRATVTVVIGKAAAYEVVDLGTIEGDKEFIPLGLNEAGTVVGKYTGRFSVPGGFLWKASTGMQSVITVVGGSKENATFGFLYGINNADEAAGWVVKGAFGDHTVGYVLPKAYGFGVGQATAINDNGLAVGVVDSGDVYLPTIAVLWQKGQPRQTLPSLNGSLYSRANGINAAGDIVGESETGIITDMNGQPRRNNIIHAVFWHGGQITDICQGTAYAINAQGQIVGTETIGPDSNNIIAYKAFLWQNGQKTDLGSGVAFAINSAGLIVGTDAERAILWKDGKPVDLNTQIASTRQWSLRSATAINNKGQIVGAGFFQGGLRAFLLTPR